MATLAATAAGCVFGMLMVPVPSRMRLVASTSVAQEHHARGDVLGRVRGVLADVALHEPQLVGENEGLAVLVSDTRQSLPSGWIGIVKNPSCMCGEPRYLCLRIEGRTGTVPDWRGAILSHFAPDHAVIASQADAVPP